MFIRFIQNKLFFSGILAILFSPSAFGFSLDDHRRMTRQAFVEFNECIESEYSGKDEKYILKANVGEDTNLFRKWLKYSHYFNPKKKLKMRRKDSSVRVLEIQLDLSKYFERRKMSRKKAVKLLGGAIHHLQDSASPPHAVPVTHSLTDGFEKYPLKDSEFPRIQILEEQCEYFESNQPVELLGILKENSSATLALMKNKLEYKVNGESESSTWELFWSESTGRGFGSYGYFGNRFGMNRIEKSKKIYELSSDLYREFKANQIRAGIDATKAALYWFSHHNAE